MSEYSKDYVIDIARRTNQNLKDYHGCYDVTQLINSAVGLLILPHANFYSNIANSFVSSNVLSALRKAIKNDTYPEDGDSEHIELRDIVKHIRNGIAHSKIFFEANNGELFEVQILDHRNPYPKKDTETGKWKTLPAADFEIVLSISTLRQFMIEFSEAIISSNNDIKGR